MNAKPAFKHVLSVHMCLYESALLDLTGTSLIPEQLLADGLLLSDGRVGGTWMFCSMGSPIIAHLLSAFKQSC